MDSHVLVAFACLATTAMALVPMSASSELKAPAGRVHRTRALYAQQGQYGQSQIYDQNGFAQQSQFGRPQQSGFAQQGFGQPQQHNAYGQQGQYQQQPQQPQQNGLGQPQLYVEATYDFSSPDTQALTFRAGDIIQVTQRGNPNDWWAGSLNGQLGWFPSNYCSEPYSSKLPPAQASPGSGFGSSQQGQGGYPSRLRGQQTYDPRSGQTYEQWIAEKSRAYADPYAGTAAPSREMYAAPTGNFGSSDVSRDF